MPTFCPHCNKMVAERPTCPNCGKKMKLPKPGSGGVDQQAMIGLMREALLWVLGIVAFGVLCIGLLYIIL